jgi:hypothetical protein
VIEMSGDKVPAVRRKRAFSAWSLAGTGVAVLGGVLTLAGCLVTEHIDFEAEQVPAHLSNPQPASFSRTPDEPDPACGGEGAFMAFSVDVADANVTENLEARFFVNGGYKEGIAISPTGDAARGRITWCATMLDLDLKCNRVEVVVSSDFKASGDLRETEDPLDYAEVEWWVLQRVPSVPIAGQDDCSSLVEGAEP